MLLLSLRFAWNSEIFYSVLAESEFASRSLEIESLVVSLRCQALYRQDPASPLELLCPPLGIDIVGRPTDRMVGVYSKQIATARTVVILSFCVCASGVFQKEEDVK